MKKKLEAELISIAHRILKLKNRSDLDQLHRETSVLLEKLSVLRFVEEHLGDVRPTIGRAEAEEIVEQAFADKGAGEVSPEETLEVTAKSETAVDGAPEEKPSEKPEEKPQDEPADQPEEDPAPGPEPEAPEIREPEVKEPEKLEAVETVAHLNDAPSADQIVAESQPPSKPSLEDELFKPAFEFSFDRKEDIKPAAPEASPAKPLAFEDLLGTGYKDPVFVKPEELAREAASHVPPKPEVIPLSRPEDKVPVYKMSNSEIGDRAVSLNDRLSKGITVGLNDRIAFVQHLFGNSNEDYNRVLSQLITFNTYEEAADFIENMVKPDYNNWAGKDEYAARFMEVVEKKFT